MSHICEKCNQLFKTKQILNRHLNKKIPCTISKFICEYCNKTFKHKNSIYYHHKICKKKKEEDKKELEMGKISLQEIYTKFLEVSKSQQELIEKLDKKNSVINIYNNNKYQIIEAHFPNAPNFSVKNFTAKLAESEVWNYIKVDESEGVAGLLHNGVANFLYDHMIKDVPKEDRTIWCLNQKEKTFAVRSGNQWKKDYKGKNYVTPEINNMKGPLKMLIYKKISDLNDRITELWDMKDDGEGEPLEIKDEELKTFRQLSFLKKFIEALHRENFSKKILYTLASEIELDIENLNMKNVDEKINKYKKISEKIKLEGVMDEDDEKDNELATIEFPNYGNNEDDSDDDANEEDSEGDMEYNKEKMKKQLQEYAQLNNMIKVISQ